MWTEGLGPTWPAVTIPLDHATDFVGIREYRGGRIGLMDLMARLEALKRPALQTTLDSIRSVVRALA